MSLRDSGYRERREGINPAIYEGRVGERKGGWEGCNSDAGYMRNNDAKRKSEITKTRKKKGKKEREMS